MITAKTMVLRGDTELKKPHVVITPICDVQGAGLWSELAGQLVTVQGVVTGVGRRGFFVQSVKSNPDPLVSDALYVFSSFPSRPAVQTSRHLFPSSILAGPIRI